MRKLKTAIIVSLLLGSTCYGSALVIPNSFTPGQKIVASEMNGNFNAVKDWANGNINSDNIYPGGVATDSIASNAVTTAKILDANVTNAKLAADAVGTSNIIDGSVTTAKLAGLTSGSYVQAYHDASCSWTVASTNYVQPSGDSSCKFEVQKLNGLTVTQKEQGSITPTLTVTNMPVGAYVICARTELKCATNDTNMDAQVIDGTGQQILEIEKHSLVSGGVDAYGTQASCGIYTVAATATKVFDMYFRSSNGGVSCPAVNVTTATASVVWTVHSL